MNGVDAAEGRTLRTLFVGESHDIEMLRMSFGARAEVASVQQVPDWQYAWAAIRSGLINSVVIDPTSTRGGVDAAVGAIFAVRDEFEEIVFALFGDDDELDTLLANSSERSR